MSDKKNLKSIFGSKLRFLRENAGKTQHDIAKLLGIEQNMISKYEKGVSFPEPDKWEKLADYFKVKPIYFVDPENPVIREYKEKQLELLQEENQKLWDSIKETEKTHQLAVGVRDTLRKEVVLRDQTITKLSMHS